MLSPERMRFVASAFAERGLRTVAVFLMRDPVDRIWSQIRMKAFRHPEIFDRSSEEELLAEYAYPAYERRTRYEKTLKALAAALPSEDVHVGLYEKMVTDVSEARKIGRLVGIPPRRPGIEQKSNASPRAVETLPDHIVRPVARYHAETYEEVARLQPGLDVERYWPHMRLIR